MHQVAAAANAGTRNRGTKPRLRATFLEYARGKAFIADAGYDSNDLIDAVREVDMKPVVRPNGSRIRHVLKLDRRLYKIRYRVEVFFHRLKRFRAIGTRYDETARNYLSLIHVACIALRLGWNQGHPLD